MRQKVIAGAVTVILLGAAATAVIASGDGVECLAPSSLSRHGIQIAQEFPITGAPGLETAAEAAADVAARGIALVGDPGDVREQKQAVIGNFDRQINNGAPVFLFGVRESGVIHPLIGTEIEQSLTHGPIMVTSPCSVVVVTPSGQILFTVTESVPIQ